MKERLVWTDMLELAITLRLQKYKKLNIVLLLDTYLHFEM